MGVILALGLLTVAPADIRSWIRQTLAMVLTTSTLAMLWAALPYTPLVTWILRDFVCAGVGGLVAGLSAPSPVLAAAAAALGVVFGAYEVLFVQYHASLWDILWLDADVLDDMTVAAAVALLLKIFVGVLCRHAVHRANGAGRAWKGNTAN
jgi:hypothetical protein